MNADVVVFGAGPGGLTAAYRLLQEGKKVIVIERNGEAGGWMRPVIYNDFSVDLGFKHIYSRIPEVDRFWKELLEEDLIEYTQRTGILYNKKIIEKEKKSGRKWRGLTPGLLGSGLISWLLSRFRPNTGKNETLDKFFYRKYGKVFTRIFLQNYDEKLKGRKWNKISVESAPGLKKNSPPGGLFSKVSGSKNQNNNNGTCQWYHPRKGTGDIINLLTEKIKEMKGEIFYRTTVHSLHYEKNCIHSIRVNAGEKITEIKTSAIISSLSTENLCSLLNLPLLPAGISSGRSVILVYFFLNVPVTFNHQSLQVATPGMKVSRITNYSAFGGNMVPDGKGCICAELFCFDSDELFQWENGRIENLAKKECVDSGIFSGSDCFHSIVIKCKGADPGACWEDYVFEQDKMRVFEELKKTENLFHINRTGSDKSTWAALMAVKAIMNGNRDDFFVKTRPDVFEPWKEDQ